MLSYQKSAYSSLQQMPNPLSNTLGKEKFKQVRENCGCSSSTQKLLYDKKKQKLIDLR